MKIVHDSLDKLDFIDICLTLEELEQIQEHLMVSRSFANGDKETLIGVKLDLSFEVEDEFEE